MKAYDSSRMLHEHVAALLDIGFVRLAFKGDALQRC